MTLYVAHNLLTGSRFLPRATKTEATLDYIQLPDFKAWAVELVSVAEASDAADAPQAAKPIQAPRRVETEVATFSPETLAWVAAQKERMAARYAGLIHQETVCDEDAEWCKWYERNHTERADQIIAQALSFSTEPPLTDEQIAVMCSEMAERDEEQQRGAQGVDDRDLRLARVQSLPLGQPHEL